MVDKRNSLIVLLSLVATTWLFPYSLHAQEAKVAPPNLNSILDSLERTGEQNPANSRPHEVTREYKVFQGENPKPISDITAEISFTPPDIKTFKITDAQGSPRGKKIVSAILDQEVVSAKEGHQRDTNAWPSVASSNPSCSPANLHSGNNCWEISSHDLSHTEISSELEARARFRQND
jgi:hypothetical protein